MLQETPVKITKTLTPDKPLMRATPIGQVVKRVVPQSGRLNVTEQRVIRRADDGTMQEKIIISPKP